MKQKFEDYLKSQASKDLLIKEVLKLTGNPSFITPKIMVVSIRELILMLRVLKKEVLGDERADIPEEVGQYLVEAFKDFFLKDLSKAYYEDYQKSLEEDREKKLSLTTEELHDFLVEQGIPKAVVESMPL